MSGTAALSDAELMALVNGPQAPAEPVHPAFKGMSDADLMAMTTPQMEGAAREVALPASNIAKGAASLLGLPGDVVRGATWLGGQQAQGELAGNPMPDTIANPMPVDRNPLSPTGPEIFNAPGKVAVEPPSGHHPLDTQSILGATHWLGITDRPDLQPQDARERYEAAGAQGVGSVLPLLFTGGATAPGVAKTLAQGLMGGMGSHAGGNLGEVVGGAPGRVVGQIGGALAGGMLAPGGGGPGRLIPSGMDAKTEALAQAAAQHGINISTGQASSSPFVRFLDSWARRMPFSGYGGMDEAQQTAFNRSLTNTFGENADKVTPQVLDSAYNRIGGVMNDVAARSHAPYDPQLEGELANARRLADMAGLQPGQSEAIGRQIDNIANIASQNNGLIPGNVYQNLTKRGEALDLLQGNRSTTSGQIGGQIRDALDAALTRGASPADVAALREARTQYKALKTVEPLTMRADVVGGATPTTGDISPAALLSRVNQQYPTAARQGLGQIPLKDLAQVGQRFLKEPPSSGTAERVTMGKLAELGGLMVAPMVSEHAGIHPAVAAAGLAGTFGAPRIVGSMLRSPAIQPITPFGAALMGAYPQLAAPASTPRITGQTQ